MPPAPNAPINNPLLALLAQGGQAQQPQLPQLPPGMGPQQGPPQGLQGPPQQGPPQGIPPQLLAALMGGGTGSPGGGAPPGGPQLGMQQGPPQQQGLPPGIGPPNVGVRAGLGGALSDQLSQIGAQAPTPPIHPVVDIMDNTPPIVREAIRRRLFTQGM